MSYKRSAAQKWGTFSIVARCPKTGMFGVAVSSKFLAVGALCGHARAGVGAVATQAYVNPLLGPKAIARLAQGLGVAETLEAVLSDDERREFRQLLIVNRDGISAAHTGSMASEWRGHLTGPNYAVAGNILVGEHVIRRMAEAFEGNPNDELPERLLKVLEAGQATGGDKRGKQSASLYVVDTEDYGYVDLRVDEHPDPVAELRRVFTVAQQELFPVRHMFPTKSNPAGQWDIEEIERIVATFDPKTAAILARQKLEKR
jgi:uncharacterized Ntn-hydrolase superfamily protein